MHRLCHVWHQPLHPVGCVGEWAIKEGVQCEWVIEGKMGEDNLGLSKLTLVRRAPRLFITVYHFYSWHLNVRESGNWRSGTDRRREDIGGGIKLRSMSRAAEWEASRNRVGKLVCESAWMCVCSLHKVTDNMTSLVKTDLLHPDTRSFLRSPEDHGFVHRSRKQLERLLELIACRGIQKETGLSTQKRQKQSTINSQVTKVSYKATGFELWSESAWHAPWQI